MKVIRLVLIALFGVMTLHIAGCETTKGAGRDIEHTGQALDDAAHGDVHAP